MRRWTELTSFACKCRPHRQSYMKSKQRTALLKMTGRALNVNMVRRSAVCWVHKYLWCHNSVDDCRRLDHRVHQATGNKDRRGAVKAGDRNTDAKMSLQVQSNSNTG